MAELSYSVLELYLLSNRHIKGHSRTNISHEKNSLLYKYDPVTCKSHPTFEFRAVQWLICGTLLVITGCSLFSTWLSGVTQSFYFPYLQRVNINQRFCRKFE